MMVWQERVFKTNKVNFYLLYQRFCWQSFIKPEGVILVRILIPKQYQMMASSVARFKFIKTKFIIGYHTKGVSIQVSSNLDLMAICYSCSNSSTKIGKKRKKTRKNFSGLQEGAIRGFQIWAGFRNYKSKQEGFQ